MNVEPIVVFANPSADRCSGLSKGPKIVQPQHLFLDRPNDLFRVRVPFEIIVGAKDLLNS